MDFIVRGRIESTIGPWLGEMNLGTGNSPEDTPCAPKIGHETAAPAWGRLPDFQAAYFS
jgi:hypothetical protein